MKAALPRRYALRAAVLAGLCFVASAGCAPSTPLLAGGRTTLRGRGDVLGGAAVRVPLGELRRAEQPGTAETDLLTLAGREGVVPVLATRIGLTPTMDLGLTIAGSAASVAARFTIPLDDAEKGALLLGIAPTVCWTGPQGFSAAGFGTDLFAVFSRSFSGIYEVWAGVRAGILAASGKGLERAAGPLEVSAVGLRAGGLVGLALGLKTVTGLFELALDYETYSGSIGGRGASARGVSLTPAFALRIRL
jgi:hypothetical protein